MHSGKLVLVTLVDPCLNVRSSDLESLDDFTQLVKAGEAVSASVVFFPMHRAPRIEEDNRNGELPALAEPFRAETSVDVRKFFQEAAK
jgi:hypothetical protein